MKQLPVVTIVYNKLIPLLDEHLTLNCISNNGVHNLLHNVITIQIVNIRQPIISLLIKSFL